MWPFIKIRRAVLVTAFIAVGTMLLFISNWLTKTYVPKGRYYVREHETEEKYDSFNEMALLNGKGLNNRRGLGKYTWNRKINTSMRNEEFMESSRVPPELKGLITDIRELKGRHSDYVSPPCPNDNDLSSQVNSSFGFLGPFDYLPNYKNPCWLSQSDSFSNSDWTDNQQKIRCVPYLYLIAATKAGSTDVFWRILTHPHVVSGRAKEVRWFDRIRFSRKNPRQPRLESYLYFFKGATERISKHSMIIKGEDQPFHHLVLADGSPTYYSRNFNWRKMPGNEGCQEPRVTVMSQIHHLWPKAKIIMVLRNPVTRLFSSYLYNSDGREEFNKTAAQFDAWVKESLDTWFQCRSRMSLRTCLNHVEIFRALKFKTFMDSIYSPYILDLLKIFPRDQIYIIQMETYTKNIKETLRDVFRFLELPPLSEDSLDRTSKMQQMNKGRNYDAVPEMWLSTRRLLEHFYAPYNAELAAIMGGDKRWLWNSSS